MAELIYVQHVLALSSSFLLNNSLSLLVEQQQQFISFKLKPVLQKHTTLIRFSYYWLNEKGVRILIAYIETCALETVCLGNDQDETKVQKTKNQSL